MPYWRFRGTVFSMQGGAIKNKLIDTSFLSGKQTFMPRSLGFRTQALKMKFATPKMNARFVSLASSFRDVLPKISSSRLFFNAEPRSIFHQAFIGETVSLVYTPTYVHNNKLFDGILSKSIVPMSDSVEAALADCNPHANWDVQFASALCPDCGWDLSGARNSIVLFCTHCHTAWHAASGGFEKIDLFIASSHQDNVIYLPFWKVSVNMEGLALKSYADFAKVVNLPRAIRPEWYKRPFSFWSPAFKTNPTAYLRLCSKVSVMQPDFCHQVTIPKSTICPVTVDAQEAFESVKVTLSNVATPKPGFFPKLPDIQIAGGASMLVLIPFQSRGSGLTQPEMSLGLQKSSLQAFKR